MANTDTDAPRNRRSRPAEGSTGEVLTEQVPAEHFEPETTLAEPPKTVDQITIAGKTVRVPSPFAEGHVLDAGQAAQLNQVFHENIRNNFAKKIKENKEGRSDEEWQIAVDEYARDYKFGFRSGGGRTADPVRREAMALAKEAVKRALRGQGKDPNQYEAEAIRREAENHVHKFMEKARRIVDERNGAGVEISL